MRNLHVPTMRSRCAAMVLLSGLGLSLKAQLAEWADQRTEEIRFERALPVGGGRWAVIGTTAFLLVLLYVVWKIPELMRAG